MRQNETTMNNPRETFNIIIIKNYYCPPALRIDNRLIMDKRFENCYNTLR